MSQAPATQPAAPPDATRAPTRGGRAGLVALYIAATFVGAALVFSVQPMVAKMMLPLLGGSPSVWNTAMLFFQATLLAGYGYAHLTTRLLGVRRQALVHTVALLVPAVALPIGLPGGWVPPAEGSPTPWLLLALLVTAGLPYFLVTTASPLLQRWFSATDHPAAADPYFLYAAGNLGSFLALLAYPVVLEPSLTLRGQSLAWAVGYAVFVVLALSCVVALRRRDDAPVPAASATPPAAGEPLTWTRRAAWVGLAFIPSSLFLGVTQFLTTDIAAVPLLWIIPLSLYLLSFVVAYSPRMHPWTRVGSGVLPVLAIGLLVPEQTAVPLSTWATFTVHLGALFAFCLLAHGRLAADRPAPSRLTEYFLWVSVGGVLGGLFNAVVAPAVFDQVFEYPLMIVAGLALVRLVPRDGRSRLPWAAAAVLGVGLWVVLSLVLERTAGPAAAALLVAACVIAVVLALRPGALAIAGAAVLLAGVLTAPPVVHRERTFFGTYSVQPWTNDTLALLHGTTIHGFQSIVEGRRDVPLSYHHPDGPIGELYAALDGDSRLDDVGVLGLGVGTMAAYGEAGQAYTFYEIDPAVVDIATNDNFFTYLRDTPADTDIVLGDARLTIAAAENTRHGLLFMNAFTSDAIPVHLLTREALDLYFDRLPGNGLLVFNVTNRYLDVQSVVAALAEDAGLAALARQDETGDPANGRYGSQWVVLARDEADFGPLDDHPEWFVPEPAPGTPVWTDSFSNMLGIFYWD